MAKDSGRSGQGLQDELLGQPVGELFHDDILKVDVATASEKVAAPLQRLSGRGGEPPRTGCLKQQMIEAARRWKALACGEQEFREWVAEIPDGDHALKDFVDFVALTRALTTQHGKTGWPRLEHLLGLAVLRLKLDPSPLLAQATAERMGLVILRPGVVDHREIAAACSLRLATVRNALSRREMRFRPGEGVEVGEAVDWMIKRKGFLYPGVNAASRERHINGRLAAAHLAQLPEVEHRRQISRLRLSEWQVRATGQRFAINSQGVQHCLVMLPIDDVEPLKRLGVQALENRSEDPTARLYQESFPAPPGQQLWQCRVPTMAVLEALIGYLAEDARTPKYNGIDPLCQP
ncbi:hypothetical protein GCM10007160_02120 [Litchfieldella qijiaojingensis]|uniref:Uncharacterized protein n=1 Tax=Litchfieldella qijiaojingensis TaxID=980347 RepID=A0ABQ2YBQ8_9GAMM|nr:hypothetical protein [Halomonas qijiaojingensis]GGX78436.1 hypothetical protein GCM10007160_02120 [Halomonas qijiaojingensis]